MQVRFAFTGNCFACDGDDFSDFRWLRFTGYVIPSRSAGVCSGRRLLTETDCSAGEIDMVPGKSWKLTPNLGKSN